MNNIIAIMGCFTVMFERNKLYLVEEFLLVKAHESRNNMKVHLAWKNYNF